MSSFVKIFNVATGAPRYADLRLSEGVFVKPTRDLMGAEFSVSEAVGKDGPTEECKGGATYRIDLGSIIPTSYHVLFSINPSLYEYIGPVSKPDVLIPKEEVNLFLSFTAKKSFKPGDFSHVARIFMLD